MKLQPMIRTIIRELKQATFLTTRTLTGSKFDVFDQSRRLIQSSCLHGVRVVKNVACLSSLLELALGTRLYNYLYILYVYFGILNKYNLTGK